MLTARGFSGLKHPQTSRFDPPKHGMTAPNSRAAIGASEIEVLYGRRTEDRGRIEGDTAEAKAGAGRRRGQGDGGHRGRRYRDPQAHRTAPRHPPRQGSGRSRAAARAQIGNQEKEIDMTKNDRDRAEARFNKAAHAKGKNGGDAAASAVLENMARLKA